MKLMPERQSFGRRRWRPVFAFTRRTVDPEQIEARKEGKLLIGLMERAIAIGRPRHRRVANAYKKGASVGKVLRSHEKRKPEARR